MVLLIYVETKNARKEKDMRLFFRQDYIFVLGRNTLKKNSIDKINALRNNFSEQQIRRALSTLNPRHLKILKMRHALHEYKYRRSYKEISNYFNVSVSMVRYLEKIAIEKIQGFIWFFMIIKNMKHFRRRYERYINE